MLMQVFFSFLLLSLTQQLFAQSGSIQLECLHQDSKRAIEHLKIEVHNDSLCLEGLTNAEGKLLLRGLPLGESEIWFEQNNLLKTAKIYIQEDQLLQNTYLFDSL